MKSDQIRGGTEGETSSLAWRLGQVTRHPGPVIPQPRSASPFETGPTGFAEALRAVWESGNGIGDFRDRESSWAIVPWEGF